MMRRQFHSLDLFEDQQTQQQTGMLFSIMQHVQPGIIIAHMQSQHAMIIFALDASPLMQLIVQPISFISILHIPIDIEQ